MREEGGSWWDLGGYVKKNWLNGGAVKKWRKGGSQNKLTKLKKNSFLAFNFVSINFVKFKCSDFLITICISFLIQGRAIPKSYSVGSCKKKS